jgi:hypothetical protein
VQDSGSLNSIIIYHVIKQNTIMLYCMGSFVRKDSDSDHLFVLLCSIYILSVKNAIRLLTTEPVGDVNVTGSLDSSWCMTLFQINKFLVLCTSTFIGQ